jgi:hypothetical protein
MLNPHVISAICWCLPAAGIFILVVAIRTIRGSFNGQLIAEIPFTQKQSNFNIPQPGIYAIWQRGPLLSKTLVGDFELELTAQASGSGVHLSTSWSAPHVNNFETGRIEWKRFDAQPGQYQLTLLERSANNALEKLLGRIIPLKKVKPEDYFFEIRKAQPVYKFLLVIPLFTLAVLLIFGGPALAMNGEAISSFLSRL